MTDENFDDGACFLQVDYSIKWNNAAYKGWAFGYALPMIFIYPIGVREHEREPTR